MASNRKVVLSKSRVRSAVTNGSHVLNDVDHRIGEMRRLRDCVAASVSDLGGPDNVSHAERVLIGRASMLTVLVEMMEQGFARNRMKVTSVDLDQYQRAVSCLRRVLETLGLQRRAKPIPSLSDYLEGRVHEDRENAEAQAE